MKNALLCPFKYNKLGVDWSPQLEWVAQALISEDINVLVHEELSFKNDLNLKFWKDEKIYLSVYNHCDLPEVKFKGFPLSELVWFFKPTVPDQFSTSLDELGYGSYSSITYDKPNYNEYTEAIVNEFYENRVSECKSSHACKWGQGHFEEIDLPHEDYYLIIGQCAGDSVVNRQDFGGYWEKLENIIREIVTVDKSRKVLVKLHPYTNGPIENPNQTNTIEPITKKFKKISPLVEVYSDHSSIHSFLPNARAVFVGNSGAGIEAMMYDKPIISFCFPEYHWVTYDLRKTCDIWSALDLTWFDLVAQRKFLYWYMEKYCFYDYNTAERRVKELLEEEVEYKTLFL